MKVDFFAHLGQLADFRRSLLTVHWRCRVLYAIPDLIRDLRRLGEMPDPGPFSPEQYAANAAAGAWWDAQQGVRKALRQLNSGRPADALDTLVRLLDRLPSGPARVQVA